MVSIMHKSSYASEFIDLIIDGVRKSHRKPNWKTMDSDDREGTGQQNPPSDRWRWNAVGSASNLDFGFIAMSLACFKVIIEYSPMV